APACTRNFFSSVVTRSVSADALRTLAGNFSSLASLSRTSWGMMQQVCLCMTFLLEAWIPQSHRETGHGPDIRTWRRYIYICVGRGAGLMLALAARMAGNYRKRRQKVGVPINAAGTVMECREM